VAVPSVADSLRAVNFHLQNELTRKDTELARLHNENAVLRTEMVALKHDCSERLQTQAAVYAAVSARGYTSGLSRDEFAARQVAKAFEELYELSKHFCLPENLAQYLQMAGVAARAMFDNQAAWRGCGVNAGDGVGDELADIQVVLYCLAESLGIDVESLAARKASEDIKRGVR